MLPEFLPGLSIVSFSSGYSAAKIPLFGGVSTVPYFESGQDYPGKQSNGYTAIWYGFIKPPVTDTYRLSVTSYDGMTLEVNNQTLFSNLGGEIYEFPGAGFERDIFLPGGVYTPIRVTFLESGKNAPAFSIDYTSTILGVSRQPLPASWFFRGDDTQMAVIQRFRGIIPPRYMQGLKLEVQTDPFNGNIIHRAIVNVIDVPLTSGAPFPGLANTDRLDAYFTGFIKFPVTDTYTFNCVADDQIRLWLSDVDIINSFAGTGKSGSRLIQGGVLTPVRIQFFEDGGGAELRVPYSSTALGVVNQPIPASWLFYERS